MMMDQKQNVLVFWSFCRALLPMDLVAEGIIPIVNTNDIWQEFVEKSEGL